MKTLTIANRKGGVGKTTSTWGLAHALAHHGSRVLLIDCDPQRNLTMSLPEVAEGKHLGAVLHGAALAEVVQPVGPNLWLVQATAELTSAEKVLGTDMAYPFALKNALATLGKEPGFDYCLFDTSPSPHSPLAIAALVASNAVFIPMQPEYFAYEGLTSLLEVISRIQQNYNPHLVVGGIFMTKYAQSYRRRLHHEFVKMLKQDADLGSLVLASSIRDNVSLAEAQLERSSIYDYAPDSNGCVDYENLSLEIIDRLVKLAS
jgi:chromosome partitioning protein